MEQRLQTVQMPHIRMEYLNVCKVANHITAGADLEARHHITTIPNKGKQKAIHVIVDLVEDRNVKVSNNLTPYDLAVLDSVYTLYVNRCIYFSPEMVVRAMSGNVTQDVTAQKRARVIESLDRLSTIRITIDCTDEFRVRKKIKSDEKKYLQSYLLPLEKACITLANKKTLQGYHLIDKPALYKYAEAINQIASVPTEVLTAGHISSTEDVVLIRRYLVRRIEAMRNQRNRVVSNRIIYEWYDAKTDKAKGMFPALGYKNEPGNSTWRTQKARIHRNVTAILEAFKGIGCIQDYATVRDTPDRPTSSICGVEIKL